MYGGKVNGNAICDFTAKPVLISLNHQVTNINSQLLLRSIDSDEYLEGLINYTIQLEFKSLDWKKAMETARGTFQVSGNNLVFYGVDLDKVLKNFELTQDFNVMNLAAIFLAGPYGSAFASGLDFSQILAGYDGEKTEVIRMVANWKINEGKAVAEDVAFNTAKYRMAVIGELDLVNKAYRNFTIAMINKQGCAGFSQTISGSFSKPTTTSMRFRGIVFGPSENMWKVLSAPSGRGCNPIYSGSIKHPE